MSRRSITFYVRPITREQFDQVPERVKNLSGKDLFAYPMYSSSTYREENQEGEFWVDDKWVEHDRDLKLLSLGLWDAEIFVIREDSEGSTISHARIARGKSVWKDVELVEPFITDEELEAGKAIVQEVKYPVISFTAKQIEELILNRNAPDAYGEDLTLSPSEVETIVARLSEFLDGNENIDNFIRDSLSAIGNEILQKRNKEVCYAN